jgi:polyhydroxyalkanoate synthesis regulator phasin
VAEAFQTYINMVTGVTKSTQAKASATARALLKQAGLEDVATEASERVAKLAEEIMNASRTNRELWQHFVATEVDKAAARLGFARADEVEALRDEIANLRSQLKEAAARTAKSAPAKKASTRRAPAKKAAATMTPTKKTTATRSSSRKPPRKAAASAETSSQPGEMRPSRTRDSPTIWSRTPCPAHRRRVTPRSTTPCLGWRRSPRLHFLIITIGLRRPTRRCMRHSTDPTTSLRMRSHAEL